jgi:hypothetical protein
MWSMSRPEAASPTPGRSTTTSDRPSDDSQRRQSRVRRPRSSGPRRGHCSRRTGWRRRSSGGRRPGRSLPRTPSAGAGGRCFGQGSVCAAWMGGARVEGQASEGGGGPGRTVRF